MLKEGHTYKLCLSPLQREKDDLDPAGGMRDEGCVACIVAVWPLVVV